MAVIMQERARREREEIDRLMAMPLWSRAVAYLSEGLGLGTAVHSRRSNALPGVPPRAPIGRWANVLNIFLRL